MIAEIQVLPTPVGTATSHWNDVNAAIDVITRTGLSCDVGPLGANIEGSPSAVWGSLRPAHEKAPAHGATGVVTAVITVFEISVDTSAMRQLTAPHRGRRE